MLNEDVTREVCINVDGDLICDSFTVNDTVELNIINLPADKLELAVSVLGTRITMTPKVAK